MRHKIDLADFDHNGNLKTPLLLLLSTAYLSRYLLIFLASGLSTFVATRRGIGFDLPVRARCKRLRIPDDRLVIRGHHMEGGIFVIPVDAMFTRAFKNDILETDRTHLFLRPFLGPSGRDPGRDWNGLG